MGNRPLRRGAVRVMGNHYGLRGRQFRQCFDALADEYDLSSKLAKLEASRCAAMWVNLLATTKALEHARKLRARGRTTRPTSRDLERLARRQGIDDAAYSQALDKLRALCGPRRPAPLFDALDAQNGMPTP